MCSPTPAPARSLRRMSSPAENGSSNAFEAVWRAIPSP